MGTPDDQREGITRHSEQLRIGTRTVDASTVRIHKDVTTAHSSVPAARNVTEFDHIDRVAANEEDSGQVEQLEDGSFSVPILEEELVVSTRLVVRERVIVRTRVTRQEQLIEADLQIEHISIETTGDER